MKNLKCSYDHEDISCHKEESDRRYFKDEESELFGTSCMSCRVALSVKGTLAQTWYTYRKLVILPTSITVGIDLVVSMDIVTLVI